MVGRRFVKRQLSVVVLAVFVTSSSLAQSEDDEREERLGVQVGAGVTIPTLDGSGQLETGFHLSGTAAFKIVTHLEFTPRAEFHTMKAAGGRFYSFMAGADLRGLFGSKHSDLLYVLLGGGPGFVSFPGYYGAGTVHENKPYINAGLGYIIKTRSQADVFLEFRYVNIFIAGHYISYVPLTIGFRQ